MQLSELVRVLLRGYKTVAVCIVGALLVAGGLIVAQEPQYRSSTTLYVEVEMPESATSSGMNAAIFAARQRSITIKDLVTTNLVLSDVVEELGLDITPEQLATHVTALSPLDSTTVQIQVVWPDPEMAAQIAEATAESVIRLVDETPSDSAPTLQVTVADPASVPTAPFTPNVPLTLGLAVLGGLLLGAAIVLLRHAFFPRVWRRGEVAVPVFAVLPAADAGPSRSDAYAGAAQALSVSAEFSDAGDLLVVGTDRGSGAAAVAAGLESALRAIGDDRSVTASDARIDRGAALEPLGSSTAVVVHVRRGRTRTSDLARTLERLELLGVRSIGSVFDERSRRGA